VSSRTGEQQQKLIFSFIKEVILSEKELQHKYRTKGHEPSFKWEHEMKQKGILSY
jgi:hypothetical protein